jgi:oxygen-independent coproporphyrinogen-3 oxidase
MIAAEAEVTLEANPGTVTEKKLAAFRALGINRLSIGVQSFRDDELRFLSRIHTSGEAGQCVKSARVAGFTNISLDLIYSLPGQTSADFDFSLRAALALRPEHMSAYSLIVEENTPLSRLVRSGQVSPNPAENEAELYERTMEVMAEHGYEHYEVSNYALPGFRSRHNYGYWQHRQYLGFGPSAHSFWGSASGSPPQRWWNVASVSLYNERLQSGRPPVSSRETMTRKDLINERIFLGLRSDGVNIGTLCRDFAIELNDSQKQIIRHLVDDRMAVVDRGSLRLTSKGYLLCDEVSERLMIP